MLFRSSSETDLSQGHSLSYTRIIRPSLVNEVRLSFVRAATHVMAADDAGQRVEGVEILIQDRTRLDAPALGVEIVAALWKLYGTAFQIDRVDRLLRNRNVFEQIKGGKDPRSIASGWQADLNRFKARRARYLLY